MKILLIGEYSRLHWTLAEGLRARGHHVTVVSDGTGWRNYPRDIDLRRSSTSKLDGIRYMLRLLWLAPRMTGYDVVQLINPDFIWLKARWQKLFYRILRLTNKSMFIGAFGYDWYWVDAGLHKHLLKYGDFYLYNKMRTEEPQVQSFIKEWIDTPKGEFCQYAMNDCDGIPACLYEYQVTYASYFPEKTRFLPLPIEVGNDQPETPPQHSTTLKAFIGIDRKRARYKGTDIMLDALTEVARRHPHKLDVVKAEDVPYEQYQHMMDSADVILDQLYSYTPSMNSLLAMSKGIVCIGGGEPENYDILGETQLRPIINVEPTRESVVNELEHLVLHPESLPRLKAESREYVRRHHDHLNVARLYEDFYLQTLQNKLQKRHK